MSKEKKNLKKQKKKVEKLKKAYLKAKLKKAKLKKLCLAYKAAIADWKEKRKVYLEAIGKGKKKKKKKVTQKPKGLKKEKLRPIEEKIVSPDDLKVVEGIGPKIEELLNNIDIYTWKALSKAKVEDLRKMLIDVNPRYRIHNPTHWPLQARLAAAGKWEELKVLQDSI